MKNYELTYLIPSDLTEKDLKETAEKIKNFIQEENGILIKTREFEKRKLGYPINKREEVFLSSLEFSFEPEKLKNLNKKLKSNSQILRYMILTKKVLKEMPIKKITEQNKPLARRPKDRKAELKEIDKKIEEILKE